MRKIAFSLLALASLAAAADLAGTWQYEQPGRGGRNGQPGPPTINTYVFQVDGNKFSGTYANPGNVVDILNGTINGSQIAFQTLDDHGSLSARPASFTGTLDGDKLTITQVPNAPGNPNGGRGPQASITSQATRTSSPEQAALDEAIAAARSGRGGRGGAAAGRGGAPTPIVLSKISNDVVFHHPNPHKPFPDFKPIPPNGLAKTPPMGWNSWNKFHRFIDDKSVRTITDAMVSTGMRDAGYLYVNIDDTWEGQRDATGVLQPNEKFPDMKALADYVHSKGMKIGIYSGPGTRTCQNLEASYNHEEIDAKTWAAWGIDYVKYDWCNGNSVLKGSEMPAAYQKMALALRSTGRDIILSLCQYGWRDVGEWGAAAGGNLWRTTGDISDNWNSMATIGFDSQVGREKYAGPGHWNDPDMLEIGNGGMTRTEYQTHMSLWSMLAAPLIAGHDPRTMPDYISEILLNKEIIAIDQDSAGVQGMRVSQVGPRGYTLEVWKKPLANGAVAVGLFNRSLDTAQITVKWSEVGITKESPKVRDLWRHTDVPNAATEYSVAVPSHGVVMLRVE